ncbi:MAG: TM0996/MTH895 family glutaredoxin-like protein [Armatimonadetes bacterium]|nr:TM0996/MTH895 family glutaredoxin-like protein [Armatimonadota bacterium]
MKVQILGTGCPKCKKLLENVAAAVAQTGVAAEIEKVTEVAKIAEFGVMFTPALAIDGEVKASGKVLPPEKIAELIRAAQG